MFQIGETQFFEKLNIVKFDYICKNITSYASQIDAEEKDMRRTDDKKYNTYEVVNRIKNQLFIPSICEGTEYGFLRITYKKGNRII